MTYKAYLFEGAAAGTSVTVGTASLAEAAVISTGGGSVKFTAAAASHGACGLEFVTSATSQYTIGRFTAPAANDKMAFTGVFSYLGTGTGNAVTATAQIGAVIDASGGKIVQMRVTSSNQLVMADSAAVALGAATPTITPGTKYRIEVVVNRAAGSATCNLYTETGTTPLGTWAKASGASMGANPANGVEVGVVSSNQAMTVRWDDLQLNDGATAAIGVYSPGSTAPSPNGAVDPTAGEAPLTVTATLPTDGWTGQGRQYTVAWGDGQTTGPQPGNTFTHTYTAAGSFQPSGTITEPA